MYFKYTDGSLIQLVQARYTRTDPQIITAYHVPLTDQNGAIPLGQDWQTWVVSGVIADPMSIRWHDIVMLSLDNISWRTCRVQVPTFPSNMYQQSLYELTVLVSPILEGAIVRFPSTGYMWGNQGIAGLSQAGNVSAYPTIHFLAPLFYAPLSNTLVDFTGQSVTFRRTASKVHGGVTYPINTPIFDSGLYLASDTAQDVATWTPPASTVRTVVMQIKSRYQGYWSGFSSPPANLILNGEFETDLVGWYCPDTTTRTTVSPLRGAASAKSVANGHNALMDFAGATFISGHVYYLAAFAKTTAAAGRKMKVYAQVGGAVQIGPLLDCSVETQVVSMVFTAAATHGDLVFMLDNDVAGEYFLLDTAYCYDITAVLGGNNLPIWGSAQNRLLISLDANILFFVDGNGSGAAVTFPRLDYFQGAVVTIVVIEDTSHALTVAVNTGGVWTVSSGGAPAIAWPQLTLGNLEGSISNLVQYPYVLSSAEYQSIAYSALSLKFNDLFIGNRYAGEIVKGSDGRLLNAAGADISALLGGTDIAIGSAAVTITQSQGLSARWYVELQRTDV